jgi:hypothetical protein
MRRWLRTCLASTGLRVVPASLVLLCAVLIGGCLAAASPLLAEPQHPTGDPGHDCAQAGSRQSIRICCGEVNSQCQSDCKSGDSACLAKCDSDMSACTNGAAVKRGSGAPVSKTIQKGKPVEQLK